MAEPIVVEVERSGFVESVHLVDVAVVDQHGALIASAGDPARLAAFRSSAKPIQARAMLQAGWVPARQELLALACASHNGEQFHLAATREILAAADLDESTLLCPLDVPAYPAAALPITERARIYHNCSGKHAAMLATCALNGWPLVDYRAVDHPLQRGIAEQMRAVGITGDPLIDGCGVPTWVAPLQALAEAFRRASGGPEAEAMRAYPAMVGGTERFDTDLMNAVPGLLTKAGAEGLTCVTVDGVGIALKIRDAANRARGPATMLVLSELGLVLGDAVPTHRVGIITGGEEPVGSVRATGHLTTS